MYARLRYATTYDFENPIQLFERIKETLRNYEEVEYHERNYVLASDKSIKGVGSITVTPTSDILDYETPLSLSFSLNHLDLNNNTYLSKSARALASVGVMGTSGEVAYIYSIQKKTNTNYKENISSEKSTIKTSSEKLQSLKVGNETVVDAIRKLFITRGERIQFEDLDTTSSGHFFVSLLDKLLIAYPKLRKMTYIGDWYKELDMQSDQNNQNPGISTFVREIKKIHDAQHNIEIYTEMDKLRKSLNRDIIKINRRPSFNNYQGGSIYTESGIEISETYIRRKIEDPSCDTSDIFELIDVPPTHLTSLVLAIRYLKDRGFQKIIFPTNFPVSNALRTAQMSKEEQHENLENRILLNQYKLIMRLAAEVDGIDIVHDGQISETNDDPDCLEISIGSNLTSKNRFIETLLSSEVGV